MKIRVSPLLLSLSIAITGLLAVSRTAKADDVPTEIYSAIETGTVDMTISNAIYPVTETSTRKWYVDGTEFTPDGTSIIDMSEGQDAKLRILNTTTVNHMQNYTVVDTTDPVPEGTITENQMVRLYVISKDNFNNASLSVRDVSTNIGDQIYADELTLYIDSTPYPNFQSLRFMNDGTVTEYVDVVAGTNTYNLTDLITGRSLTVNIVGIEDTTAPEITKLVVADEKADTYATTKTLQVEATDDYSLSDTAYYWEDNTTLAETIKSEVLDGGTSDTIQGITWTSETTHDVSNNGTYTVFVRDSSGNIAYKDITVSKISNSTPEITSISLKKKNGKAYFKVVATDSDGQTLYYKLNDGKWQTSAKLKGVVEGKNKIYVKNECGNKVKATRTVYLSLFLNKESDFSEESLYNYIKITPSSWTSKSVTVSLVFDSDIKEKLADAPYSINGGDYSTTNAITVSENSDVEFKVKDIYGKEHSVQTYSVTNIDKENPYLEVSVTDGTLTVNAGDSGSGIQKIEVNSTNVANFVVKSNSESGITSDSATYTAPANGTYKFTVYDYAGNTASAQGTVDFYTELKDVQASIKSTESTGRSGNTTGGESGSSTLGTKESESEKDESKDYVSTSSAGHTKRGERQEAEKIEVLKTDTNDTSGSVQMIETVQTDESNFILLKKLIRIMLPVLGIGVIVGVLVINGGLIRKK